MFGWRILLKLLIKLLKLVPWKARGLLELFLVSGLVHEFTYLLCSMLPRLIKALEELFSCGSGRCIFIHTLFCCLTCFC